MPLKMRSLLCFSALCLTFARFAPAQVFEFPETRVEDRQALAKVMSGLARQVVAAYKDPDLAKYLGSLYQLQVVAGDYREALRSLASLREIWRSNRPEQALWLDVQYEIYASARAIETADKLTFANAYNRAFRDVLGRLDDKNAALAVRMFSWNQAVLERQLQGDLDKQKGKKGIALADAVTLLCDYQADEAYRRSVPLAGPLIAEDDTRRYVIDKDLAVKMPDGATVCTLVVRPRKAAGRVPALLQFTIYAEPDGNLMQSRLAASHGYAGVIGLTRGKGCSPDKPWPYVHDGADAAALIDWITAQPWSDGRVGMYGGSYSGFTAWAAAKLMPKGLKTIMVGAPAAPGIDVPMEGNVVWNFIYPWPFYTTDVKGLDDATYNDSARWNRLNREWYVSGRAYRDMEKIDGTPNPIFDEWISHPDYDAYWQGMIPNKEEFARVKIPVLMTAGYYFGGPGAAVYYFREHQKYDPGAEDYLLIGPYHHFGAQVGAFGLLGNVYSFLAGMELDPVALVDIEALRYQWFDFVLKGGPRPTLIGDKVNYQVTGANVWKHAPTLAAMADEKLRLYLTSAKAGSIYRLSRQKPARESSVSLTVDLADRSDVDRKVPGGGVIDSAVDTWNGVAFVSEPLASATEMSGLFSGRLEFGTNKKDFDFEIDLYELTPKGDYVQLAPCWLRASFAGGLDERRPLTPGLRQTLSFESIRLMSRRLGAGSRVVMVLRVIKESARQINYGTGKDVSEETIQDAKAPLEIKWFGGSYVDLPVRR